ncbi:hypothetical protein LQW54_006273 [Pestalotiopsis sp. IQ-011]
MNPPTNPRIAGFVERWSRLPVELIEPILAKLPLHRLIELSLSPNSSPAFIETIKNSPSRAWLFRSNGENNFDEIRHLYKAIGTLAWAYGHNTRDQTEITREHFAIYDVGSGPLPSQGVSHRDPMPELRDGFMRLFLDVLPVLGRTRNLSAIRAHDFQALCVFLPDDIMERVTSASELSDARSALGAQTSTSPPVPELPLEVIKTRAYQLLNLEWTVEQALRFVPYLLQAYADYCRARSSELLRISELYEQYPTLLKRRSAPEHPLRNLNHIPARLRADAKSFLRKPLRRGKVRSQYHFADAYPTLVSYSWCMRLFQIVVEKYPVKGDGVYPDELVPDLQLCLAGISNRRPHAQAMVHSPAELEWLEACVHCVDWMYANASHLGVDLRECIQPQADIGSKILLNAQDFARFIEEEPVETIAEQIKLDVEICDDASSTKLPSLLGLYLPSFSTPRARKISDKLTPGLDIATQQLIYNDTAKKLKRGIHKIPEVKPNYDDHQLPYETLESDPSEGSNETKTSWAHAVRKYADSRPIRGPRGQKPCYICRYVVRDMHQTFPSLCKACGEFNLAGSNLSLPESLDLNNRVALVTGARINLGYHTALRLLRCGARVIASTRYPEDALSRYQAEPDFAAWEDRLRIIGADFRAAADAFGLVEQTKKVVHEWGGRLDILINNAAQTLTDSIKKEKGAVAREAILYREGGTKATIVGHNYILRVRGAAPDRLIGASEGSNEEKLLKGNSTSDGLVHTPPSETSALQLKPEDEGPSSWVQSISEIPYEDVVTAQSVNALVPLILMRELLPLMYRQQDDDKKSQDPNRPAAYVVNVSSREGIFESSHKSSAKRGHHVHTNMSKAALNMITETEAVTAWRGGRRVAINTVDPGYMSAAPEFESAYGGERPIGWEDGAGRVLWPVAIGEGAEQKPVWGRFLKHYGASRVDVRWGRG